MEYELLSSLNLPDDIKTLTPAQKEKLCGELRDKIIETVSQNGGHLASNLGVVELTLACHSVFDSPDDKIIFDVGHQSYVHKLLTGRYERFDTLRKKDGISGFSRPDESEHDPAVSGHSSNSISVALGIAQAMKLQGDDHHAIAIIGDGALTGGLAYEGLNNAGRSDTNIIVILNYNEMSISKNIGGIAKYLSELRTRSSYRRTKDLTKKTVEAIPLIGKPLRRFIHNIKQSLKEHLLHSTFFEDLGFEFIGPVNGHDVKELEAALLAAKSMNKPTLVQVITSKGKGYAPAEKAPGEYHGVPSFDVKTGEKPASPASYGDRMGTTLASLARKDDRICAITAAMKYATGLNRFDGELKPRLFDVGIAEEHAVSYAAGLAKMGMIPVFSVYSSFLQRSYDELIHDVCIAGLHVVLCIGNAGLVGEDGETHQGMFDVPMLTTLPNTTVYSPSSFEELDMCLEKAIYQDSGLACIRYPKGAEIGHQLKPVTDYEYIEKSADALLVSYGRISDIVISAADSLGCDSLRLVSIYPLSDEVKEIVKKYKTVFVFEESSKSGGIGEKLACYAENIKIHAIDGFVPHMKVCEAFELYGYTKEKIIEEVRNYNGQPT